MAAFAAVIVVVLLQGGAGKGWTPQRPAAARHDLVHVTAPSGPDAVAQPAQASQTIAQTNAGAVDEAPLDRAVAAPAEFVGRWFACPVVTDALPVWWPPQRAQPQAVPIGNAGKATNGAARAIGNAGPLPSDGHGQLARLGGTAAPFVADLMCQGTDLRTWPVRAFFDQHAIGALPAIGNGTAVALQLLGTDAGGNLQARYLRILERPRLVVRSELPDWTALWTGPLLATKPQARCRADGPAELRDAAGLDPATLAQAATAEGVPPELWLSLRCRDARGPAVPLLIHGPREAARELLGVTAGSEVAVRLEHAGTDGLVAGAPKLVDGGVAVADADLRRVLLDDDSAVGRKVVCTSQGLPLPEVAQPEDPALGPDKDKAPLVDRKAWVVCAQPAAPAVHAYLYLPADHADRLLQVVRGTTVEARVLGIAGLRLQLLVERATPPTGPAAAPVDPLDPPDLRRLVLFGSAGRARDVRCRLTRTAVTGAQLVLPTAALQLGGTDAVALARLWCGDQVRPHAGQPIGVVGPADAAKAVAALGPGSIAHLRFVGVVENQPVAVWVRTGEVEPATASGAATPDRTE